MAGGTRGRLSTDFWAGMLAAPVTIVVVAAVVAPLALLQAWAISVVWGWYVVPAFGLAPLRIVYAYGLALLIGLTRPFPPKDDTKWQAGLFKRVAGTLVALGFGWLGTWFI